MKHGIWIDGRQCWLLDSGERHPDDDQLTFSDLESARHWLHQLCATMEGVHIIRAALSSATRDPSVTDLFERDLLERAAICLLTGDIEVILKKERARRRIGGRARARPRPVEVPQAVPPMPVAPEPVERTPLHWIEIELIGEDDGPIPNEAYIVVFPDGKETRGRLNRKGFARIGSIAHPGNCKVSFPNLDTEAWDRL